MIVGTEEVEEDEEVDEDDKLIIEIKTGDMLEHQEDEHESNPNVRILREVE